MWDRLVILVTTPGQLQLPGLPEATPRPAKDIIPAACALHDGFTEVEMVSSEMVSERVPLPAVVKQVPVYVSLCLADYAWHSPKPEDL